MLPFLKDRHEGGMSGPIEKITISDGGKPGYGMFDAICEDMLEAVSKNDKKLLKGALEALVEHIQEEDELQDHEEGDEYDNQ
jgi:hypothetical protein